MWSVFFFKKKNPSFPVALSAAGGILTYPHYRRDIKQEIIWLRQTLSSLLLPASEMLLPDALSWHSTSTRNVG